LHRGGAKRDDRRMQVPSTGCATVSSWLPSSESSTIRRAYRPGRAAVRDNVLVVKPLPERPTRLVAERGQDLRGDAIEVFDIALVEYA
jgi:hypothetical protein